MKSTDSETLTLLYGGRRYLEGRVECMSLDSAWQHGGLIVILVSLILVSIIKVIAMICRFQSSLLSRSEILHKQEANSEFNYLQQSQVGSRIQQSCVFGL